MSKSRMTKGAKREKKKLIAVPKERAKEILSRWETLKQEMASLRSELYGTKKRTDGQKARIKRWEESDGINSLLKYVAESGLNPKDLGKIVRKVKLHLMPVEERAAYTKKRAEKRAARQEKKSKKQERDGSGKLNPKKFKDKILKEVKRAEAKKKGMKKGTKKA